MGWLEDGYGGGLGWAGLALLLARMSLLWNAPDQVVVVKPYLAVSLRWLVGVVGWLSREGGGHGNSFA